VAFYKLRACRTSPRKRRYRGREHAGLFHPAVAAGAAGKSAQLAVQLVQVGIGPGGDLREAGDAQGMEEREHLGSETLDLAQVIAFGRSALGGNRSGSCGSRGRLRLGSDRLRRRFRRIDFLLRGHGDHFADAGHRPGHGGRIDVDRRGELRGGRRIVYQGLVTLGGRSAFVQHVGPMLARRGLGGTRKQPVGNRDADQQRDDEYQPIGRNHFHHNLSLPVPHQPADAETCHVGQQHRNGHFKP